ncbi:hypothetical protein CPB85DRAFT_1255869 [Mucidula mucida]|nr:hypothetical protein CPB85DRAFT_1255869 [Mucidula mucida]
MALIHDCFIVINQAQRGAPLDSAFSVRSRLLSLYIVEEDVSTMKMAVGMDATKRLFELRDRTLFCGKNERGRMSLDRGCEESRELQEIIQGVLAEPPLIAGVDCELLDSIQRSLNSVPPAKQVHVLRNCNAIRKFFDLGPWRPHPVVAPPSTDDDELFLLHDIFHSLGYDDEDSLISLSISSSADEHIKSLILARDLLTGALPDLVRFVEKAPFRCQRPPLWAKLDQDLTSIEEAFRQNDGVGYWLSYMNSRRGLGRLLPDVYSDRM